MDIITGARIRILIVVYIHNMKRMPLNNGLFALVDNDDYDELSKYKWSFGARGYAMRCTWINGEAHVVSMHRCIMNPPRGKQIDHKNGNRLDNRKSNLRVCTPSQNSANRSKDADNTSGYKGVYLRKYPIPKHSKKIWLARYGYKGKLHTIGSFETPQEAARAYNEAAKKVWGEFAQLNDVM